MYYSEETKENLRRFTLFQVTIYIPHFLMSSIGSDAAVKNLTLHKKLQKFRDVDEVIRDKALKTLERHLWYLSDLTMALFSDKVDLDNKARMAAKLLALKKKNTKAQKLRKPKFPQDQSQH